MIDERLYERFREIGRDLYVDRLVSSHGGNMSVRLGDRVVIKRHEAMLGRLSPHDLIETGLERDDGNAALASTDLSVHRAIYQATAALAIVHAHPRVSIALSFSRDEIVPLDHEASCLLKKIPVVETASGGSQMAQALAESLKEHRIVMLRGHGSFAAGQTLEEAFQWTSALEECSQIILAAKLIDEPFIEYR
jgi:L-fuculose-phosphate aldolase